MNQDSSSSVIDGADAAYVTIGSPSTSRRWMIGSLIVRGSSWRTFETASLTSFTARSVFVPSWNSIMVLEDPSVIVDLMCLTFVTPATESSTRLVTCVSSSTGAAPDCVMSMVTIGMSMFGKRVIAMFRKLRRPSVINTRKSTSEGIGRRIDHAEMFICSLRWARSGPRFAFRQIAGRSCRRSEEANRLA